MHHTERNVATMSDKELLALLVGVNADSFHMESISDVLEAPMTLYGIGEKKALKVEAIGELVRRISSMQARKVETIHGPEDVAHVLMPRVKHEQKEHFMLMCLNTKNHVIAVSDISIGSLSASIVHPREVFKEALARSAAAIIIAHNHPSGDPSPSREDISVTQRLIKSGKVMDIPLLDHIVLGTTALSASRKRACFNKRKRRGRNALPLPKGEIFMVYRLTRRSLGRWEDVMEEGEPFDFDTEEEAIDTLNVIHWRNYKGTPMNYRAVSDEELEAEGRRWAMTMAYNM